MPAGFPDFAGAFAGPVDLPPLSGTPDAWRAAFARHLYGPVPPPPDALTVERQPLPGERTERLVITVGAGSGTFTADAALWLPEARDGPVPVICGLDFAGPSGILTTRAFPLDPHARVYSRPELGADGLLAEHLRGTAAHRWPVPAILGAGHALIVACYGSWVPDDPEAWEERGLRPLLDGEARALSLWAWTLSRLVDVAERLPETDGSRLAVAGHSRLGKAALWAAANDPRIAAVFANASGCGGAAPARHAVGETLARMAVRFPHWIQPVTAPPDGLDQHHLLGLVAPRALYLAEARDDLWADPVGSYLALTAAAPLWPGGTTPPWPAPERMWTDGPIRRGALGWHIRPGGHDMLPHDWHGFLDFLTTTPLSSRG